MKKKLFINLILGLLLCTGVGIKGYAAVNHTVVSGDTMWKIAVKYQMGVSEIISANPKISNPNMIYPGQVLTIPTANATVSSYEQQVIDQVNNVRVQNGLKKLTPNWELSRMARYKSQDMKDKNYFSHTSPTYGSPFDMMKSFGISYRSAGENIAMGQTTPQAVMNAWMNSSGHRANILNPSYTQIGVGYVAQGNYWTQEFIG